MANWQRVAENVRHDLKVYWLGWRIQFSAAARLRGAFMWQIIAMMFNNAAIIVAWWFLFKHFGVINGWGVAELIGVQGVNMVIFGVMVLAGTGIYVLPRYVDTGTFDVFLTRPNSILAQLMSSTIDISAFGDLFLGLGLVAWYIVQVHAGILEVGMFVLAIVVGVILLWCFTLMPFLLAFYMFDSEKVARNMAFLFLDISIYPTGILTGGVRTFLLTAFPGLFVGAVPLDAMRGVHWEVVLFGVPLAFFWLWVTLRMFRGALRKYESANLVGAR